MMIKSTILKVSVVALSLGMMTGCASTSTSQMQEDIARAQATADEALAKANAADERCGRIAEKAMAK